MTQREVLRNARQQMGVNQQEFAAYFGIPQRTLVDWEREERKMPDYLLRLMMYKLEMEKLVTGLLDEVPDKENMIRRGKNKELE